ncbi:MAG: tyrosine-type recombinase/integrase [Myxococcales bacterium]|nr:tyrosine-type recombinase/integrase [Myxococcales bacterium]
MTYGQPPRYTQSTIDTYGSRIVNFVEWAERQKVVYPAQVSFGLLQQFMRHRADRDGVGGRTINRDFTAMNAMFRYAVANGFAQVNPFANGALAALKLREPRPKPSAVALSPKQVDTFLAKADEISHPAYAALYRGTAGSAVRIDEILNLEPWEVDEARMQLTISPKRGWTTKGYRYRDIPISRATAKALKVFLSKKDEVALDQKSIWKELQRIRENAGLPHFSMHDLRRAWASAMHDNGASLKRVSVWLGHADVQTTERYIRVFMDASDGHQFLPR